MSNVSFWDHPIEKLEEALNLKRQIHALQTKLGSLFDGGAASGESKPGPGRPRGGRRKFSAASRAKMAAAQRARWAKAAGDTSPAKVTTKKAGSRTMSPEARERIAAAQRARWAKAKGRVVSAPAGKAKRNLSPEGRARIVAAQKARHAAKKAKGKARTQPGLS